MLSELLGKGSSVAQAQPSRIPYTPHPEPEQAASQAPPPAPPQGQPEQARPNLAVDLCDNLSIQAIATSDVT